MYEQQNAINKDWHLERYFITEKYANKLSGFRVEGGDIIVSCAGTIGETYELPMDAEPGIINQALMKIKVKESIVNKKMFNILFTNMIDDFTRVHSNGSAIKNIPPFSDLKPMEVFVPEIDEQNKISFYFSNLDRLITLHQRKQKYTKYTIKYTQITLIITKEKNKMPELEKIIEEKLIEQLVYGESQWTYRDDLKTGADLWKNFKYILEQNNKDRLNGEPLSDTEFEQVKNQLQFSSFYKAGEWLVGENGKVQVHVQRDTERLHLVVMNHEHIAGGSSVYEVINQYSALGDSESSSTSSRDRRFDVTLLINGLPMIHIELKNKDCIQIAIQCDSTETGIAVGWHEDWLVEAKENRSLATDFERKEQGNTRYTHKYKIFSYEEVDNFKRMISTAMKLHVYSYEIYDIMSGGEAVQDFVTEKPASEINCLADYIEENVKCEKCGKKLDLVRNAKDRCYLKGKECSHVEYLTPDEVNNYIVKYQRLCPIHHCPITSGLSKDGVYVRCEQGHFMKPDEI